jgi:hypothetical protein
MDSDKYRVLYFIEKIINSKKLKHRYSYSYESYFFDLTNQIPDGILINDIIDMFQYRFPSYKISVKDNYLTKYGILVEKK